MTTKAAGKILKALYSASVAALGMCSTILVGNATFGDITAGQWTTIALFSLVSGGGVYGLAGWSGPTFNGSVRKDPPPHV